jgi:predicted RNA-binding Zn-ribbon protein involved in translation (DUF1610 family)
VVIGMVFQVRCPGCGKTLEMQSDYGEHYITELGNELPRHIGCKRNGKLLILCPKVLFKG